jgi:P2-related tail formation protein
MNLLPNNSSIIDQNFAHFLEQRSKTTYQDIKIDVMSCDVSLLPHLALIKGVNITDMTEYEARLHIKNSSKKSIGTVGAVEDVLNVCFENAKLVEWFEKEDLEKGYFDVSVDVKADKNLSYDERLFKVSKRLIDENKNVRSKLRKFDLSLKGATDIKVIGAGIWTV